MINFKTLFKSNLPLTPKNLVNTLKDLSNKVIIEKSILDEIALMASGSDITSLLSVAELTEIAECIKSRGLVLIEDDSDPTLVGGTYTPISTWTLFNKGTDVSVGIAWVDGGSSVIYHRLEMYVNFSTNKVILSDAPYKIL